MYADESCLTLIYGCRAPQSSSDYSVATTMSNRHVAKRRNTPWLVNHIPCGWNRAGKRWQPTPSWISSPFWRTKRKTFRWGSVVGIFWQMGRARQTNKLEGFLQMFFDGCVMSRVGEQWEGREIWRTWGDHIGGKPGSVDRAEGWFGKCEVGEMKRCED